MRCALTIIYNGSHFLGSQIQTNPSNTVMGTLEHILKQINIDSKVIASGRTDKGVHATGQVCHLDLPPFWRDLVKLKKILNEMLPKTIYVKKIQKVSDNFHARYDAKKRIYRYVIKQTPGNPFENDFVTFLEDINFQKIEKNIKLFIGEHDFKFFMKTGSDVNSTKRILYNAFVYQHNDYTILHFEANGFLRSQIRLMVATLLKLEAKQIQQQLDLKRDYKIKPADCNGLYLAKVKY